MVAWPHKGSGALEGEENPFAPWPSALSIVGITVQRAELGREGAANKTMEVLHTKWRSSRVDWAAQPGMERGLWGLPAEQPP